MKRKFLLIKWVQLSYWKNSKLSTKVVLLSTFVSLTVSFVSIGFALSGYKNEKLAHLLELHNARTSSLSLVVSNWLRTPNITKESYTATAEVTERLVLRPPMDNEIFWLTENEQNRKNKGGFAVWKEENELRWQPTNLRDLTIETNEFADIAFTIINSEEKNVLLNGISKQQGQELYAYAKSTGLKKSQTIVELWKSHFIVSTHEIYNTNLLLISMSPVSDLFLPLKKTLIFWLSICILLFFIGATLQNVIIVSFTVPLKKLNDFFEEIVVGRTPTELATTMPELKGVLQGANVMQKAIQQREERLRAFLCAQEKILKFVNNARPLEVENNLASSVAQVLDNLLPTLAFHTVHAKFAQSNFCTFAKVEDTWLKKQVASSEFRAQLLALAEIANPHSTVRIEAHQITLLSLPEDGVEFFILAEFAEPMHLEENNHLLHDFAEVLKLLHAGIVNVILKQQLVSIKIAESLSKRELELARKIHEKSISEIPNLPFNVKVSSFLKAAQHVGGDWLAVYSHPHLGLVNFYIGDVTGHGLDSAFLVSTVAGAVKMSERELEAGALRLPGEINFLATNYLKDLYHNLDALVKEATEQKQMTFAAGILDTSSGQLYFLNAGHLPPLFLNSAQESLLSFQNGPLGDGSHRHETEIKVTKLQPNQALVFYTDGLLENLQHSLQKLGAKKLHKKMNEIYATQNGDLHDFAEKVYNWTIAHASLQQQQQQQPTSFFEQTFTNSWENTPSTNLNSKQPLQLNPVNPVDAADDVTLLILQWLGPKAEGH